MKYSMLQSIVLLFLLCLFFAADYGFIRQHDNLVLRIEDLPIVIFSHDWELLEDLSFDLQQNSQIGTVRLESNIEIFQKMITDYDLPAAEQILDIDLLPNMLEFSLDGNSITKKSYRLINQSIEDRDPNLLIVSQDTELHQLFTSKETITLLQRLLFGGTLLLLFVISLIFRIVSIKKSNFYWQIFYRSGGTVRRSTHYLLQSGVATLLPIVFIGILLYLAEKKLNITYVLNLYEWFVIAGIIFVTSPIAWIFTGKDFEK